MSSRSEQFPPRVRFNWGFHDATSDVQRTRAGEGRVRDVTGHFDRSYADGYTAGISAMKTAEVRPASSDSAWDAHTAAV